MTNSKSHNPEKSGLDLKKKLSTYLPIFTWGAAYNKKTLINDLVVALIVTVMLIPQSLAYAQLAGLPAEVGLYASMLPLILYAIFGTSRTLAVGPVAVASLMTLTAISPFAEQGTQEFMEAAIILAFLSGLLLMLLGFLKLGFLANFLSHPVVSGFITASGIQIAGGQLSPLLGIPAHGETFYDLVISLWHHANEFHVQTAIIGISCFIFLYWVRASLSKLLIGFGLSKRFADIMAKIGPVIAIIICTLSVIYFNLHEAGVRIVGTVPQGLPELVLPKFNLSLWQQLVIPALLISIVGYVESISVAQTLAAKRRQRVDPNQELIALGASNIGSAVSGGFPVTGGFSRSVVNFEAGAETPAAGAFTAIGIALVTLFLTPLLFYLPNATLAATIMIAVLSLVDLKAIKHAYDYSPVDAAAMGITILTTLLAGIEIGLICGVSLSLLLHLFRTSKPHIAIVGQLPGTANFRNVERHHVVTDPNIVMMRIDESLYFPNARYIEDRVNAVLADQPNLKHFIIQCNAINSIDLSALESLIAINQKLKESDIGFHLAEVKGPVMDKLKTSPLMQKLNGTIYLSLFDAFQALNADLAIKTLHQAPSKLS